MYYLVLFFTLLSFLPIFIFKKRRSSNRLPPGSLGIPCIGQSLSLLRAMRANTAEKWFQDRVNKYGPISKLTLFGTPTVFIHGQEANKFVFTSNTLNNQQLTSVKTLFGKTNLLEVSDEDHKRIRGALLGFLKPDVLKQYVGIMDGEIKKHFEMHWQGKQTVTVMPLMKTLTFDIMCSLLFNLEHGERREKFVKWFEQLIEGIWTIPVNFPFTRFNRSIQATTKIQNLIMDIIHEKKSQKKEADYFHNDLISSLLSLVKDDNTTLLSDQEIVDNVRTLMVAGHDTSSGLLTFLIRHLANDPVVYAAIQKEQEDIATNKSSEGVLTWEDLAKMKYTWRTTLEILRIIPPMFAGFRRTRKDTEFGGYLIPKGWQVCWAAHMTHMNDSIFPEPTKFDPSRFENQASIPPYCYVAFGGGPRICPGYEFARIEVLITMHYLVTGYKWKLCCKDNNFSWDPIAIPTQGLPINIVQNIRLSNDTNIVM